VVATTVWFAVNGNFTNFVKFLWTTVVVLMAVWFANGGNFTNFVKFPWTAVVFVVGDKNYR
jgi:hypothetical protein